MQIATAMIFSWTLPQFDNFFSGCGPALVYSEILRHTNIIYNDDFVVYLKHQSHFRLENVFL